MKIMSVKRKRFRVEQAMGEVVMPEPEVTGGADLGPMHREIMAELRSIRAQMAAAPAQRTADSVDSIVAREVAEAHALLETYRAQVEQCEKLKVELDLIHDAISRTKREIAVLHGKNILLAKNAAELHFNLVLFLFPQDGTWGPCNRSPRVP